MVTAESRLNIKLALIGSKKVEKKIKGLVTAVQKQSKASKVFATHQAAGFRKLQAAILGAGLAMLFFGMSLKNVSQKAMKSVIKTWTEAMEGTTEYNMTLGRLNAAFEFLKFAIADAFLTSSLGQMLIEALISIFDFVSSMPAEFLKWIVVGLLIVFLFGTVLMVTGMITLAILGAASAAAVLEIALLPLLIVIVLIALLISAGIVAIILVWNSKMTKSQKVLVTILIVLIVILGVIFLIGVAMGIASLPILLIAAIIILLIVLAVIFWDKLQIGAIHAWNFIKTHFINPMIDGINKIIEGINNASKGLLNLPLIKKMSMTAIPATPEPKPEDSPASEATGNLSKYMGALKGGGNTDNSVNINEVTINAESSIDSGSDVKESSLDEISRMGYGSGG